MTKWSFGTGSLACGKVRKLKLRLQGYKEEDKMVKKLIVIGFLVFAGIYSEAFGDAVLQDAFRKVSIDGIGVITIEYKSVNIIADKWSDVFSEDWKQQFLTPGKTDVLITK